MAIEGTSGSELYRKYRNGTLEQSYSSYEGGVATDECFGPLPEKNEFGQIDEWRLIDEIEKEGILYDEISDITLTIRNYSVFKHQEINKSTIKNRKWWQFWKNWG